MADKGKPCHEISDEDRRDRLLAITVQPKETRVSSVRTWNDNVPRFDGHWNSMLSRKEQAIKKKKSIRGNKWVRKSKKSRQKPQYNYGWLWLQTSRRLQKARRTVLDVRRTSFRRWFEHDRRQGFLFRIERGLRECIDPQDLSNETKEKRPV